ncbi:biotin transporter BioY [Brachyspira aalborgi]|uniref:biotin transporter BioY n=1 Tax=Brachyspira aalborgi TaxID=29522 RepID=UPI00266BFE21|nr:biotin transporter BioY [Brachyspira aalborgi]
MTTLIKKYNDARVYLINDAGIVQKMALSILFAVILAVASQIKIFLSFTPVPINLGTFAVCIAGMTLGGFWGFVSVAIYMLAAAVGLPVIAGSSLIGATTGYIIGYGICAFALGKWTERGNIKKDSFVKTSVVLFIFQIAIIHICGMIGLYIWSVSTDSPYTLTQVIMNGTIPFLFGDSIKAIILSLSMGFILKK